MDTELAGKVVLVTGASGGIGSAIARAFAAEAAKLVLHYHRHRAGVMGLQRELREAESLVIKADLTKEAQVKRLFATALERFGRIDSLIANAGSWEIREVPLHRMPLRHWQRTIEGVLTTCFLSLREFLRIAARQKRGNAVLIASTAAVFGEAGHADYASGKAAIARAIVLSRSSSTRSASASGRVSGG